MDDPEFPGEGAKLLCATDNLSESTKQHVAGRRFHSSEEAVAAIREWLRMQSPVSNSTELLNSSHDWGKLYECGR